MKYRLLYKTKAIKGGGHLVSKWEVHGRLLRVARVHN